MKHTIAQNKAPCFGGRAPLFSQRDLFRLEGATLVFTADGKLYTGSFSGLDPNAKYKVTISYDSGYYTISGGMSISGLVEADAAAND